MKKDEVIGLWFISFMMMKMYMFERQATPSEG
jgi:hypothetical protein